MRRSSADPSSAPLSRTTEASSAWENLRPIADPICATFLAGPSRSSRAISEACRLAGTIIVLELWLELTAFVLQHPDPGSDFGQRHIFSTGCSDFHPLEIPGQPDA